jgi:uncharacterized protein with HEPN domain
MTLQRLPDYINHMLGAIDLVSGYLEGMPKPDFMDDKRTQQAVVLNLIVIGEVASKIIKDHEDFAKTHANVQWNSMKGMRNRIAHGYYDINLDTVWETAQTALPQLKNRLLAIQEQQG